MPTHAILARTTVNDTPVVAGTAYILTSARTLTIRELIAEKVRAEFRKYRINPNTSSLDLLLAELPLYATPQAVQLAIGAAESAWHDGRFAVVVDGVEETSLDARVAVRRGLVVEFRVREEVTHGTH